MQHVNLPEAVAELTAAFQDYELALTGDDIAKLNELFWNDPSTLRYGSKSHELLYGHAAIAEFRITRGPTGQNRTLRNTVITTFGRDFGTANTEYVPAGSDRVGRQSQTWVRTDEGWRIVSAHVSYGT